jgi:hypothetical protein
MASALSSRVQEALLRVAHANMIRQRNIHCRGRIEELPRYDPSLPLAFRIARMLKRPIAGVFEAES